MTSQPFRLPRGGLIDRGQVLSFTFDGARYQGHPGDTLASALLANGVRMVGRSFKYHRPRGIYTAGAEEPNALVRLRRDGRAEPNTRATMIELYDALEASSQNRWPALGFDLGAISDRLAPLLPAGFYYKTFMWPRGAWRVYEKIIRRMAGLGAAPREHDPDLYRKRHVHCDLLVVGGGPAGLTAALTAARLGAQVVLVDDAAQWGGQLKREDRLVDGGPGSAWVARTVAELARLPKVRLLPRTTAFGYYDHNLVALVERVADHVAMPPAHSPRQRLWCVRARWVVLATGAIERPIVFPGNDRPGVMLAGAARAYVHHFAVRLGNAAVLFTGNDDAYRTALALADAGIPTVVVDPRPAPAEIWMRRLRERGIELLAGHAVVAARGSRALAAVEIAALDRAGAPTGPRRRLDCDLLALSGGWNPTLHLHAQSGGAIVHDDALAAYVPGAAKQAMLSIGAAAGRFSLAAALADGAAAGARVAQMLGLGTGRLAEPPRTDDEEDEAPPHALPVIELPGDHGDKSFVDLQTDVTSADIALAQREGFVSVEHVKRYTTLGMGTDQGKTSNLNGLAILAARRGMPVAALGTTTFRPPYTPVAFGALVGQEVGTHFAATRRSAMHEWHAEQGAAWIDAGLWLRPRYYPRAGEEMRAAVAREARHVREAVGLVDVTTLGKIDLQGPDSATFLNRVYVNGWSTLAVGRARYGLMLREDGMAFDDGTTSRLGEHHFLMTTTTANAARVLVHLEYYLQVVWPDLRVQVTSVTEEWAAMALAGPASRRVLAKLADIDVGAPALPFMGVRACRIAGLPARVFRISFSGELAYEINVPADWGRAAWEAVMAAGKPEGIIAYGTEAMAVLRIEKGHVAGAEVNGQTTPHDLGLGSLVSTKKDFIGRRLLERPALQDPGRQRLVGLVPLDRATRLANGAHVTEKANGQGPSIGHVTSTAFSPTLGHPIALALVAGGPERQGGIVHASDPLRGRIVPCTVTGTVFVDPEGKRLHG